MSVSTCLLPWQTGHALPGAVLSRLLHYCSLLSELPSLSRLLASPCLGEVRPGSLPWCRTAQLTRLRVGRWRDSQASAPTGSTVIESLPANGEDPLEEEMATRSSTLA